MENTTAPQWTDQPPQRLRELEKIAQEAPHFIRFSLGVPADLSVTVSSGADMSHYRFRDGVGFRERADLIANRLEAHGAALLDAARLVRREEGP